MKLKKLNIKKVEVIIDKSLEKYDGEVLFPEKLERANRTLKKAGPVKLNVK